jgi:hypothetical protein
MDLLLMPIDSRGAIVPYLDALRALPQGLGRSFVYLTDDVKNLVPENSDYILLRDSFNPSKFAEGHSLYGTADNPLVFFQSAQAIISEWIPKAMQRIQKAVVEENLQPATTLILSNSAGLSYLGHFFLELGFRHFLVLEPYRLLDWKKLWRSEKSQFLPEIVPAEWVVRLLFSRRGKALAEQALQRPCTYDFEDIRNAIKAQMHMYSPQLCQDSDLAWGYPYPEGQAQLGASLQDFINRQKAEQRPIFLFTLGSMDLALSEKERLIRAFIEGAESLGAAALVLGWQQQSTSATRYYLSEFVRYTALFPQVDLIVSHCGAGTAHLALYAGKPVFAIPFLPDQIAWAESLKARHLLVGQTRSKDFTAARFKEVVERGLIPEYISRAQAAGEGERQNHAGASQRISTEIQRILASLEAEMPG